MLKPMIFFRDRYWYKTSSFTDTYFK